MTAVPEATYPAAGERREGAPLVAVAAPTLLRAGRPVAVPSRGEHRQTPKPATAAATRHPRPIVRAENSLRHRSCIVKQ